jgi:aminoglycoside phosphotransferase (APT) family kinase protein
MSHPSREIELFSAEESAPQNWAALRAHLKGHGHELAPEVPRQFRGGYGNLNYLVEIGSTPAVLRRPPLGPVAPGANDMAREHRILTRLSKAFHLVPRGIHLCEDTSVLGAPFQLIEFRPGIVIRGKLPTDIAAMANVGARLSCMLTEELAMLHAIDPKDVELDTLGRPEGFMGRTVEGWLKRASVFADILDGRGFAELASWLRAKVPPDRSPTLLHSDFKLDNVILDPKSLAPRALIDWDMGTRGDPLWDVAVLLSYWSEPSDPDCMQRLGQMPTSESGFWRRSRVLKEYVRATGRDVTGIGYYRVLATLRSAVIFLQLFDRYRRDPKLNPRFAEFDRLGRELVDFAFEIAQGRAE